MINFALRYSLQHYPHSLSKFFPCQGFVNLKQHTRRFQISITDLNGRFLTNRMGQARKHFRWQGRFLILMKSILQDEKQCYFCMRTVGLERHHCLSGVANRPLSERYGLWVWLCYNCHTGKDGAQYDPQKNRLLKAEAQKAFEKDHTRTEWMKLIGKNYL